MKGIEVRHLKRCKKARADGSCCNPTIRAMVWVPGDQPIRKTFNDQRAFPTRLAEAEGWHRDVTRVVNSGEYIALRDRVTLDELWTRFHDGALSGAIRQRNGRQYSQSTILRYDQAVRAYVLIAERNAWRPDDLRKRHVDELVEAMLSRGLSAHTVRGTVVAVRGMYRWALKHGQALEDPTKGVELPAAEKTEKRAVTKEVAAKLIEALPERDRALWATALYTGLRRSEVLGLHWDAIDLETGRITVQRTYNPQTEQWRDGAKTRASWRRQVPVLGPLKPYLLQHKILTGRRDGQVFAEHADMKWSTVLSAATSAWKRADLEGSRVTFHECRHSYVSWLIEAAAQAGEVNVQALMKIVGHTTYQMFFDTYGHLLPDAVDRVADAMEAYLGHAAG